MRVPVKAMSGAQLIATSRVHCHADDIRKHISAAPQDFIFSAEEADERFSKHVVIPQLRLMTASGALLTARNAVLFRVDSLEGDKIGQALVLREVTDQAGNRLLQA